MSWKDAGAAWGARAADWAALVEPWNMPVYLDVFDRLGVTPADRVLDVACGSALAGVELRRRGAAVSGLDASENLVAIARERSPDGDFRVGDISELPWDDDEFDVVVSFNGIWGLDRPMAEARRVLRPGGRFAISFFGDFDRMDLMRSWAVALVECSPPDESGADLLAVSRPGAAEGIIARAGMEPLERGATASIQEFADVDAAVRAYSTLGPAITAIGHVGEDRWSTRLRELFQPFVAPSGVVRLVNEWGWVIASA